MFVMQFLLAITSSNSILICSKVLILLTIFIAIIIKNSNFDIYIVIVMCTIKLI